MSTQPVSGDEPSQSFEDYVEHPRYGTGPRYSGLDVNINCPGVRLTSCAGGVEAVRAAIGQAVKASTPLPSRAHHGEFILGTAVIGDPSSQQGGYAPITHFYDLAMVCRSCARRFIFFADEQKHWYEELQFYPYSIPHFCPDCRMRRRRLVVKKKRYDVLCNEPPRSLEQTLEMADCCVTLLEAGVFGNKQTQHIRALLNTVAGENRTTVAYLDLRQRLLAYEASSSKHWAPDSPEVDRYIRGRPPNIRPLFAALRETVLRSAPKDIIESIFWGGLSYRRSNVEAGEADAVCWIMALGHGADCQLLLAFDHRMCLHDLDLLLQGGAPWGIQYVRICSENEARQPGIPQLIRQAAAFGQLSNSDKP